MPFEPEGLTEEGWCVVGMFSAGRGVVVVRSDFIAFIPTERLKHLAVEFAKVIAGFSSTERKLSISSVISAIQESENPPSFIKVAMGREIINFNTLDRKRSSIGFCTVCLHP